MPGFPIIQKKSRKFIPAKLPSSILVVSPTMVAAPCKLEDTAMAISTGTGEIFSFREMASPTGATISTVATLSTKALMTPANSASTDTAHLTLGTRTIHRPQRRRKRKGKHAANSQNQQHRRTAQGHPGPEAGQAQHQNVHDGKHNQSRNQTDFLLFLSQSGQSDARTGIG